MLVGEPIQRPLNTSLLPPKAREEDGTFWLWAWPELLQWPRELVWLFSPVVGRRPYPGDMVGVDELGSLVYVETKLARNPLDPYEDFIGRADSLRNADTEEIERRWQKLLRGERGFIDRHLHDVENGRRFERAYPGVVPYSSRRFVLGRWPQLYRDRIVPNLLESGGYEEKGRRFLDARFRACKKLAYFVALFRLVPGIQPTLTAVGRRNRADLVREAGAECVHACAVEAVSVHGSLNARSWGVRFDQS